MNKNLFEMLGVDTDVPIWSGMPFHKQDQAEAEYVLIINVDSKENLDKLADLIDQKQIKVKAKTNVKSIWYPKLVRGTRGSNSWYVWKEIDEE